MGKSRFTHRRYLAPKLTISHSWPWHLKIGVSVLAIALVAVLAWWTYDLGRSFAFGSRFNRNQLQDMQEKIEQLTTERDRLQLDANTIESKLNIDHSMQKQLAEQVKTLTSENQKLKDDLAFFEGLMPSGTGTDGITVQNLKVELQGQGQLRYRALVMQGVKNTKDFDGELQFSVSLVQAGKPVTMAFPDPKSGDAGKLKLSFKHYQRLEGVIAIPDGATAKNVQVKVLERGVVRAQQAVNL